MHRNFLIIKNRMSYRLVFTTFQLIFFFFGWGVFLAIQSKSHALNSYEIFIFSAKMVYFSYVDSTGSTENTSTHFIRKIPISILLVVGNIIKVEFFKFQSYYDYFILQSIYLIIFSFHSEHFHRFQTIFLNIL